MNISPQAYSYIRFSSPEQSKGDSYRRQLEASQRYAKEHNLTLNESTFKDLGVSGFRGKNASEGALGAFIEAVDNGRIAKGSYLLVESLDRISRDKILPALNLFIALLEKGITIVTLADNGLYTKESVGNNPMELMASILIFARANEESEMKSKRLTAAWSAKKQRAQDKGEKVTSRCPAWMKLNEERTEFKLIPQHAKTVSRIFELALAGYGGGKIATTFNREGLPAIAKSESWHSSYITKILRNRSAIGEYQPQKALQNEGAKSRKQTNDGPPIKDYYPSVVSSSLFHQVQAGRASRRITVGPKGHNFSNLLSGLASCMHCGSSMHYVCKGKPPKGSQGVVCSAARRGLDCKYYSVQLKFMEPLVLGSLYELDFARLLADSHPQQQSAVSVIRDRINSLESEQIDADERLVNLINTAAMLGPSSALVISIKSTEDLKDELKLNLGKDKIALSGLLQEQDASSATAESFKENYRKLSERLTTSSQDELYDIRSKINQQLKSLVSELSIGHWSLGEEVAMADSLESWSVIDSSMKSALLSFFDVRTTHISLRLKSDSFLKARHLLINRKHEVLRFNETFVNTPSGITWFDTGATVLEEDSPAYWDDGIPVDGPDDHPDDTFSHDKTVIRGIQDVELTHLDKLVKI